jgi:hypothetical protein
MEYALPARVPSSRGLTMTTATTTDIFFTSHETKPRTSRSQLEEFDEWFSRCRNTLEYTACLILADSKMAESAVQNCWFKASRNPPGFNSEGASAVGYCGAS